MKLVKIFIFFLFLFIFPKETFSEFVGAQNLREISHRSELIVFGKVESIEKTKILFDPQSIDYNSKIKSPSTLEPSTPSFMYKTKTLVSVYSILKGKLSSNTIYIYSDVGLLCPRPPSFEKDENVVVFLRPYKFVKNSYATVSFFYGKKTLSPDNLTIYQERIREILEINSEENEKVKNEKIVEWLVKCVEHPVTRLDAVQDFSSNNSRLERKNEKTTNDTLSKSFLTMLTSEQKIRIINALFNSSTVGADEVLLLTMLENIDTNRLIPFILSYLHQNIEKHSHSTYELMFVVAERKNNKDALKLANEYKDCYLSNKEQPPEKKRKILTEFLAVLSVL